MSYEEKLPRKQFLGDLILFSSDAKTAIEFSESANSNKSIKCFKVEIPCSYTFTCHQLHLSKPEDYGVENNVTRKDVNSYILNYLSSPPNNIIKSDYYQ